jgi:hypothetical protein
MDDHILGREFFCYGSHRSESQIPVAHPIADSQGPGAWFLSYLH